MSRDGKLAAVAVLQTESKGDVCGVPLYQHHLGNVGCAAVFCVTGGAVRGVHSRNDNLRIDVLRVETQLHESELCNIAVDHSSLSIPGCEVACSGFRFGYCAVCRLDCWELLETEKDQGER